MDIDMKHLPQLHADILREIFSYYAAESKEAEERVDLSHLASCARVSSGWYYARFRPNFSKMHANSSILNLNSQRKNVWSVLFP